MQPLQPPPQGSQARSTSLALARAPFALVQCDATLRITSWNDGAQRTFGYAPEEVVGRGLEEVLAPTGEPTGWAEMLRDPTQASRAWAHARKDGGRVVCDWSCQPILDEHDAPIGHVCSGHDVTRLAAEVERCKALDTLLRTLHDKIEMVVWRVDSRGTFTYHDGKGLAKAGLKRGEFLGKNIFDLYPPEALKFLRRALAGEAVSSMDEAHGISWETWVIPTYDEAGALSGAIGIGLDVSDRRRTEQELEAKKEVVERQQLVIRDLSTPIIQVWDGVLTLPMIGLIDSARTAAVMDSLLEAVARTRARFAILDLTGVDAVDTQTAANLLALIRAIRLLGAEGILTGIRSSVAQTVAGLGVDLEGVKTLANLAAGLRHCIVRIRGGAEAIAFTDRG
jgi:rsbT co-antagonist protein RsbR